MEQRRLRLGDILDDYCPRERRVTNHAVVAMIEENVKQTRCTTCDAEHVYKGARVPKRRKKDAPTTLYEDVLAGMSDTDDVSAVVASAGAVPPRIAAEDPEVPLRSEDAREPQALPREPQAHRGEPEAVPREGLEASGAGAPRGSDAEAFIANEPEGQPSGSDEQDDSHFPVSEGPVHRRLIRATLPRPEGQKDTRPMPEFTVRQSPGRGAGQAGGQGQGQGNFRAERMRMRGNGSGTGEPNGNRAHSSGGRFHSNRPSGSGRQQSGRAGGGGGFRGGNPASKGRRGRGPRG